MPAESTAIATPSERSVHASLSIHSDFVPETDMDRTDSSFSRLSLETVAETEEEGRNL